MKHCGLAILAGVLVLGVAGCMMPKEFEAKLDVKKDGSYEFSYEGTVVSLAMLADAEDGKLDKEGEKEIAADIVDEIGKMENASNVSYVGNSIFKVSYKATGNVKQQPLLVGMKELPFFTFAASTDGSAAVFRYLPDADIEAMRMQFPASGLSPKGTIVVTTELPVESSAGDPSKNALSSTYTWKVEGIDGALPAMTLKLQ